MDVNDLKKITIETPIYHPLWGKGFPIKIESDKIVVEFINSNSAEFGTSGVPCKDHFLRDIFLKPVKIIEVG
jgi:hypothetical protein